MTRKEAAGVIKFEKTCVLRQDTPRCNRDCKKCDLLLPTEDVLTAYDMAIKALEQQPCEDTISRQAAIEVIDAVFPVDPMKSEYAQGIACGAALAKTYVEQLPSAQPEDYTELKREFIRMASYIDSLLICSDEQKETLIGFISRLAEHMPWTERD